MTKSSMEGSLAGSEVSAKAALTAAVDSPLPFGFSRDWLWGLTLVLAVILTYQPVWYAGFVWDDSLLITANPCIIGPLGLKEIWTTSAADICPITMTTFWVEHALWGLAPLPYHLVNVFMHAASAVLLWRVLRSLNVPGAWLGAALWALHPVQVESVAWVSEMKNTESGVFFLLTILFFVKWLNARDSDGQTGGGWNYALVLLFAALAMTSKSSTVILPGVLCLCAWWMEGRWRWRHLASVVPVVFMAAASSVLSIWTQKLNLATVTDSHWARTWPERLVTAGDAVWFYLGKLLWPHPLITIYPRWQIEAGSIDAGRWVSYLPLLAVMGILFILWLKRASRARPWFFVVVYFLAALLPVLGLVDNYIFRYSMVFDHFQYLASMGPLALAGAGIAKYLSMVVPNKPGMQAGLCAGLLLILGSWSWHRACVFESEETLWTDTLAKNDRCWLGRNNLGLAFVNKGQMDEAVVQYQKALDINPNYTEAHNNLGVAFSQKGQVDEAMAQYQRALDINPNYTEAHNNLGAAFSQKGQVDEAMAQYQMALEIDPDNVQAHNSLGAILFQKGQVDEAMAQYQKALEIDPNYADAHNNLGVALSQRGQLDEAVVQFQTVLKINPDYAEAQTNLGNALLQKGLIDQAIAEYQKVLEMNPNAADVHSNLGVALFQKGQVDDAIVQFQEAVRLKPDDKSAQNLLARAQSMARQNSTGQMKPPPTAAAGK